MTHGNCPTCGAPVRSEKNYGTSFAPRWCVSWACGRTSDYDGPGKPCSNENAVA